ncbi:MAG: UDP-3-O-[3-hydroxymyristoyl] N-acetylglucosamine deacetylase, partial [Pseudomonadota bacterium]
MLAQRTIKTLTQAVGVGLHSGQRVELTLKPAPVNTGIVFRRVDLAEPVDIHINALSVTDTRLASTISSGQAKVHTVE